jgi:DNA-binding NtrC family response regulator
MAKDRILVVDDDQLQRWAMGKQLASWNYEVIQAEDGQAGLEAFTAQLPDLVLLDLQLPDQSGVEVLRQIRAVDPQAVVIMVTAHGGVPDAVAAFKLGAFDYLSKPLDFDALGVTLRFGLEARHLRAEVERLRAADREPADATIVGHSPAIARSIDMLRKLAPSGAGSVLLTGESGTGKDLAAKAIHYNSARASKPFMNITCSALPETLLESELFGHERGAFTGADRQKRGLIEMADGGTVFLDEIGEMVPLLQAKLLRFLEEKSFKRVGGATDIKVDVRVIAATNRDLEEEVRKGQFRSDLYYRLNVVPIKLPPLRQRPNDIPRLVNFYVDLYNTEFRKRIRQVSAAAMEKLKAYSWPGNVRELRNAVERAMLLAEGDELALEDFPVGSGAHASDAVELPANGVDLEQWERSFVQQALERSGWNQTRAANLLGLNRDQIRYRIEKFKLERHA